MAAEGKEGEVTFNVPEAKKECKTWYKIFGDLSSSKTPLIVLHGGPGCCHDYLLPIVDLTTQYSIPTIFYDQIGNGKSTHLPESKGDEAFWIPALFKRELDNLVDHLGLRQRGFHLLGHSWGGMLAAMYAVDHHADSGLQKVIVSNSPASMKGWSEAAAALREQMPETNAILTKCEKEGRTEGDKEYEAASIEFYKRHVCRIWPFPEEMNVAMKRIEEDTTTYHTMNGPNEFYVIGNLKGWSVIPDLGKIENEVMLVNGEYDEAADSCVKPYFDGIKKVKWRVMAGCSHFSLIEDRKGYMDLVAGFLL